MQELRIEALLDKLEQVQTFIDEGLEAAGASMKVQIQIDIAVEELYVNIAHYAYSPGTGEAVIRYEIEPGDVIRVDFMDHGVPFDPLAKPDADITLSAEERSIGGLGILMVKKSMDEVLYRNEDGWNITTIRKKFK